MQALTVLIGRDIALLEWVRPVLEASGTAIFHLGAIGAGRAAELAAIALALIQMEAAREASGRRLDAWSRRD